MDKRLKSFVYERYEGSEKTSRNKKKPCSRFDATDELVAVYKGDTPGQRESVDLEEAIKRVVKGEKTQEKTEKTKPTEKVKKPEKSPFPKSKDDGAEEKPTTDDEPDRDGAPDKGDSEKAFGGSGKDIDKKKDPTALDKKLAQDDRAKDMDDDDEAAKKIPSGTTKVVLNPEIDQSGQDDFSDKEKPTKTVGGDAPKKGKKKMKTESVFGTPENFGLDDDLVSAVRAVCAPIPIEELSRKTLSSYVKKASDSRADAQADYGYAEKKGYVKKQGMAYRTVINRRTGIRRAADKLGEDNDDRHR